MNSRNVYFKFTENNQILIEEAIKNSKAILDHGCGDGTWTKFFEERGKNVLGYRVNKYFCDSLEPKSKNIIELKDEKEYLEFVPAQFNKYDTWFLSWPPYNTPFAYHILNFFMLDTKAKKLLYIGEDEGGCTGDDAFFDLLYNLEKEKKIKIEEKFIDKYTMIYDNLHIITKI